MHSPDNPELDHENLQRGDVLIGYSGYRSTLKPKFRFRMDPVPHTAKRRGGAYYYRTFPGSHPKRMALLAAEEDPGIGAWRQVRRKYVPNPWDDFKVGRFYDRSWKRFRKTKWRQ